MSAPHLAFVLAAGQSKRMRSKLPKVLHPAAGKPLLRWSVDAAAAAGARPVVVLSPDVADRARAILPGATAIAIQPEMRGTGDAVRVAVEAADAHDGEVFVLYGDTPTLSGGTLDRLRSLRAERGAAIALLTARVGTDNGYGRIVRDDNGDVRRIVEVRLATPEERQLPESNLGAYAIDLAWLRTAIGGLKANSTGEIFFTDIVDAAIAAGQRVAAFCTPDPGEGMGVNTRIELAAAEAILRRRIRDRLMLEGVTFHDPESTMVDDGVRVAADAVIERGCVLEGTTAIGPDSRVGPYSILRDTTVGARCIVEASVLEGATLEDDVRIGPYSHLRPGAYLEQGVGMGNFGEVKAARLRKGTKMHHFSYVGDADVGERVNIGAGTITMNYDGVSKHRTTIGNDAFIGSDTLLRAPITIGEGAVTGAGAVVTKDVAPGMLAVGVPARAIKKASRPAKK
ncbi:MAG TPA: bifunctional UDP-N-acetylglucosamine diphosphorylase/glucosamine-1-phosphate N-acetyltransferase GlmU [Candidatus Saccharimonadales bacterium]|nr:bifunctional UDP-N-acetylglucosamine diphosphorylase/glucosamine-1-phosphate N-acetyltransferase GlmU [Candidatus Saccharimonadales bacterium]